MSEFKDDEDQAGALAAVTRIADNPDGEWVSPIGRIRRFNLLTQDTVVRGRLPTLDVLNDRFARFFRTSLFRELRCALELKPGAVELIKHAEFIERLEVPSFIALVSIKPLNGTMLISIDAKLAHSIVEIFFGGTGKFPVTIGAREFTTVEQRVLRRVIAIALREFVTAWEPVQAFEPEVLRYEFNPQFSNVASPSDLVIVSTFRVIIENGGGWVTVCMPYNAVEQLRDQLMSGVASDRHADDHWFGMLRMGVQLVNLHATAELLDIEISVNDLLKIQTGDVFEVEIPETVTITLNNMPLYRAKWGQHRGKAAIRIELKINEPANLLELVLPNSRRIL